MFGRGDAYRTSCSRVSGIKISCQVNFSSGLNDYYGSVTIHYLFGPKAQVEWTDNYVVRSVNERCYFHSGHRTRCRIQTKRGSW